MKEIKAYVRVPRIAGVLEALRDSGLCEPGAAGRCHNFTVVEVQRPLTGADPSQQHYSIDLAEPVVAEFKLEIVCADDVSGTLVDVIARAAHTGQPDAGWIFVSDVQQAIEIQ